MQVRVKKIDMPSELNSFLKLSHSDMYITTKIMIYSTSLAAFVII